MEIKSNIEGLELYSDQYPFRLSLKVRNFENEADYVKFIRNCERHVRNSIEYKLWKSYIVDVLGISTCMMTEERMDQCTIEVHHHIPSLFVLVKSLINKKVEKEDEFSTFDIALKTIELHFQNKIGYVTLLKSMHEKFHNGYLGIPADLIRGNYKDLIDEYSKYIDDEDLDIINQRLSVSRSNHSWVKDNYPGLQEASG